MEGRAKPSIYTLRVDKREGRSSGAKVSALATAWQRVTRMKVAEQRPTSFGESASAMWKEAKRLLLRRGRMPMSGTVEEAVVHSGGGPRHLRHSTLPKVEG